MSAALAIRDVVLSRDGQRVLDGVSLSVAPSEVVAVTGPSGAGKSTLLRVLVRFEDPDAGSITLDGVDVRELEPAVLRRRVGLVFQRPAFVDGSVWENVTVGPRLRGEAVDESRVRRVLERLDVADLIDQSAVSLSGGEAQRVALARTLVNDPDVLLLDEPTANLDPEATKRVESVLRDAIDAFGVTVVVVTHDATQARRLADRVLSLADGHLSPTEVDA